MIAMFALYLISLQTVKASTSYCDDGFCLPDKYCCGHNECCTYVWTMWYLWLAFASVIFIGVFVLWKLYLYKNNRLNSNDTKPRSSQSKSAHRHSTSSLSNQQFMYLPLNNNEIFLEKQLDENVIQAIYELLQNPRAQHNNNSD